MFKKNFSLDFSLSFNREPFGNIGTLFRMHLGVFIVIISILISVLSFYYFHQSGLNLAYNDARSHLDIARRVVEGLKPGLAQLGSVWLPLPHFLMIPTVWNDFMWHSGLSGAIISMISFVATSVLIYLFLKKLGVGILGIIVGVGLFILNLNVLYLQSTAMTELLLIATSTASSYYLMSWIKTEKILDFIKSAFFIFLSTLTRYDGWFLFLISIAVIFYHTYIGKWQGGESLKKNSRVAFQKAEGYLILFCTLGAFGILIWFMWNALIFKDPLYFAFGPYSARAQQQQLEEAGNLITKGNLLNSIQAYTYAVFFNLGTFISALAILGGIIIWLDKKITASVKIATFTLIAPLFFNIIALFLGHSVLFIQGINGDTWFNVRYGVMLLPAFAIFIGFLVDRLQSLKLTIIGLILFITFFAFSNFDAVTIDDARVGSSQKNVSEVSGWLKDHAKNEKGFVLISAASHDAIIFSSSMEMKRFIHEGTGDYWKIANKEPDRWARWIVMRTNDTNDEVFKLVNESGQLSKYNLVNHYPFADIYQLKDEFLNEIITEPILGKQK